MASKQGLIFVIGCPGSGKSSLSPNLAADIGWTHLSVGDELRKYTKCHPEDTVIAECVRQANLIPVEKLVEIMKACMEELRGQSHTSFIVDGLPRDVTQIDYIDKMIGAPDHVLFMDCSKDIAKQRVLSRNLSGRTDNEEVFKKRYAEFCVNNLAIVEVYETQGKLIKIDTSHTIDLSYANVLAATNNIANFPGLMSATIVPIIYIIGVSATGKTTLVNDLAAHFKQQHPQKELIVIPEVARELVLASKITPAEIRAATDSARALQKEILETQLRREIDADTNEKAELILADRSGIDPIVYATEYGVGKDAESLVASNAWDILRKRMRRGNVILCEPVPEWFIDDGVRIVPVATTEVNILHQSFRSALLMTNIAHTILPKSTLGRQERVAFVLGCLGALETEGVNA